jgi:hypothetical protein
LARVVKLGRKLIEARGDVVLDRSGGITRRVSGAGRPC